MDEDDIDISIIEEDGEESDFAYITHVCRPQFQVYSNTPRASIQLESHHALSTAYADLKKRYNDKDQQCQQLSKELRSLKSMHNPRVQYSPVNRDAPVNTGGGERHVPEQREELSSLRFENGNLKAKITSLEKTCRDLQASYTVLQGQNRSIYEQAKRMSEGRQATIEETQQFLRQELEASGQVSIKDAEKHKEMYESLCADVDNLKTHLHDMITAVESAGSLKGTNAELLLQELKRNGDFAVQAQRDMIALKQTVLQQKLQLEKLVEKLKMDHMNKRHSGSKSPRSPRTHLSLRQPPSKYGASSEPAQGARPKWQSDVPRSESGSRHHGSEHSAVESSLFGSISQPLMMGQGLVPRFSTQQYGGRREPQGQGGGELKVNGHHQAHSSKKTHQPGTVGGDSDSDLDDVMIARPSSMASRISADVSSSTTVNRGSARPTEHLNLQIDLSHRAAVEQQRAAVAGGSQKQTVNLPSINHYSRKSPVESETHTLTTQRSDYMTPGRSPSHPQSNVQEISPDIYSENRFRPSIISYPPTSLNIERNDHSVPTAIKSTNNAMQNVNLNSSTAGGSSKGMSSAVVRRREQSPPPLLNNNPLLSHKEVPRHNVYVEHSEEETVVNDRATESSDFLYPSEVRSCPVCCQEFPATVTMNEFQQHVLDCIVPDDEPRTLEPEPITCPVCDKHFPPSTNTSELELHVNSHFDAGRNEFEVV